MNKVCSISGDCFCGGDIGVRKCRQYLFGDAPIGAAELHRPVAAGEDFALCGHERHEGDERGELAAGDDGVLAFKAAPESVGTGLALAREGAFVKPAAARQPDILIAVEKRRHLRLGDRQVRRRWIGAKASLRLGRNDAGFKRGFGSVMQSFSDGLFVNASKRWDIRIMVRRDLKAVADGESCRFIGSPSSSVILCRRTKYCAGM